ncbi:transcriptional regulator [Clostridium sp. CAG:242]|nr:transcriptional regulator [Clostridium sp. CAG:242]
MKLSQLEYFQTICKHCNLTRAAEELHVSQPSLTHVIHDLEQEFGLTLFLRQNKGLVLTEEGRQFLDETNRLLEQTNYFVSRMKILGQSNQVVHFGLPPASATLFFVQRCSSRRSSISCTGNIHRSRSTSWKAEVS